jgi:predicted transcriptional regulator
MPSKHPQVQPTAVKLDAELKARLEHLSQIKDRSTHWLNRENDFH